jgi:hypothetical protein
VQLAPLSFIRQPEAPSPSACGRAVSPVESTPSLGSRGADRSLGDRIIADHLRLITAGAGSPRRAA